jgi:hypothetical protein
MNSMGDEECLFVCEYVCQGVRWNVCAPVRVCVCMDGEENVLAFENV